MFCLFILCIIWAAISLLFSLINSNPWLWFVWVPVGLVLTVALFLGWLYAVIFPVFSHTNMDKTWKRVYVTHVLKFLTLLCGVIVKAEGQENIPKEKNVLFVSNHKSLIDPLMIYQTCFHNCAVGAKSTLWKVGPLLPLMSAFRVLKIDRDNDRNTSAEIIRGYKLMRDEPVSIIIFPEGGIKTRDVEQMVEIKPGCYKLATKSNSVIQPIAIIGNKVIDKWRPFVFHKVTVRYLKPIYPEEYASLDTIDIAKKVYHEVNENYPNEEVYNDQI